MKSITVQIGDQLPSFTLPTASGGTVSPEDFRGRRLLILFYRGHW